MGQMRRFEKWWRVARRRHEALAIEPLLDLAARELDLASAEDWELAGDVFGDFLEIDESAPSGFDSEAIRDQLRAACSARAARALA
jgi:hypothetical protein